VLVRIVLVLFGAFLATLGWSEYGLLQKSSAQPVPVELRQLEAGDPPPNLHLAIGHHWKLWPELIYMVSLKKGETEGPKSRVDYVFYPIISEQHPYSQAYNRLAARREAGEELTPADLPVLESVAVLVRTTKFQYVGNLPKDGEWGEAERMTGMVVNDVRSLREDEKALLRQSFGKLDFAKVLIFEESRAPASMATALGLMAGGVGLALLGLYLIVELATGKKKDVGELPPLLKASEVAR
jgi:hypothetical protein